MPRLRDIPTPETSVNKGSLHTYRCYDSSGKSVEVDFGAFTANIATQTVQRIRAGGRETPHVEKPYLRLDLRVSGVAGKIIVGDGGRGRDHRYTMFVGSHPWDGTSFATDSDNVSTRIQYPFGRNVIEQHRGGSIPGVNPDLLSQAEVKCYNKLRNTREPDAVQLDIWYGERRETARLFQEVAESVWNVAKAIARKDYRASARALSAFGISATAHGEARRLRRVERLLRNELKRAPSAARRTLRGVEDAALTYNLGLSPLMQDLVSAHQRLLRGDLDFGTRIKAVARHSILQDGTSLWKSDNGSVSCTSTLSYVHGYTVTLVARPVKSDLARLASLGLTNPAATVWQLARFTFLIDYIVSIGPFLDALHTPMAFEFVEGSYTRRIRRIITCRIDSRGGSVAEGGRENLDFTQRSLYGSFPVPIPPLSLNGKDQSVTHAVNAGLIALKEFRKLCGLKG